VWLIKLKKVQQLNQQKLKMNNNKRKILKIVKIKINKNHVNYMECYNKIYENSKNQKILQVLIKEIQKLLH